MTEVAIPGNWWDDDQLTGSVSVWLYRDGARVQAGDPIAEILVEKTSFELTAPVAGVLRIQIEPEVPFSKGAVVARIDPA